MGNLHTLRDLTLEWSEARGILKHGKVQTQALKLVSEVGELCDNVGKGRDIKDDIGDCLVVLTNLAALSNLTLEQCWAHAYNEIKDRKGYLNEHGNFIKDGDIGEPIKKIAYSAVPNLIGVEHWFKVDDKALRVSFKDDKMPIENIRAAITVFTDGTKSLEQFRVFLQTLGEIHD
jgi:hypothetical protein